MATSMPTAFDLGILDNGTDQTSNINTALANSNYAGILFDYSAPGAVTVNGTIAGQGKVLKFTSESYLAGSGTINNFILDAGYRQKCFDISLTVNPAGTTLDKISLWIFGAKADGTDASPAIQACIDLCIRNLGVNTIFIPSGTYTCNAPLICQNWNGSIYVNFQISIEGEANFWESSGYGTVLDFSGFHDTFGIGFQTTKGSAIRHLKLIGAFNYIFTDAYTFYNTSLVSYTDGVCRDSGFSPYAGIVVDPFGPSVPSDGGYPGLTAYYRGMPEGSTGLELDDVFFANWVIGFITSPSGQTENAELISAYRIQLQSLKIGICGCQSQEKLNVFRHIGCWGVCHTVFLAGYIYGAASAGNWYIEDVNLAGFNNQFIVNPQSGYFPSFFSNIFAESLGRLGLFSSHLGTTFQNSNIEFANYMDAGSYQTAQIEAAGVSFIGCNFRMYGTNQPVTIYNTSGGSNFFNGCAFETVPFFTIGYPRGINSFTNCTVFDINIIMGPTDLQYASAFSESFAYGNNKIYAGSGNFFTLSSIAPAAPMNINRTTSNYVVNTSLVGGFYQATITCPGDELNRVFVGDVIVGSTSPDPRTYQVMGILSSTGSGSFTINYIPSWVVSGTAYYLFIWLPLYNIAFTGDATNGSNQITNVAVIAGDLSTFMSKGALLFTTAVSVSDAWQSELIRLTGYNPGTGTITFDKTATASATKNLFTNANAVPDPQIPAIVGGSGAGSSPTVSIVKGNDRNMQINVSTGSSPAASAPIAIINFGIPFAGGYIPSPKFSPANAAAAALNGGNQVFMDATLSSEFIVTAGSTGLSASTTYLWNVEVG